MPTDTFAPIADKVKMIIRMFSSDCEGDVLAAQRALMRLLKSNNCDIHAVADSIGNGKRFSEAEAAKIYQRGVEDGRREAELAQGTPVSHDAEELLGGHGRRLHRPARPVHPPRTAIPRNTAVLARHADGEATQLARRPV